MIIEPSAPVGVIVTEHPAASRVLFRHEIDFCCGGDQSLAEACDSKGVELETILRELEETMDQPSSQSTRWDRASVADLISHLLIQYHRPLDEELPRLDVMARKVLAVHGDEHPEPLTELVTVFAELKGELERHMVKEEQILFPMIQSGRNIMADGPIAVMEAEHEDVGVALRRIRELTNNYRVPVHACATWTALWHGLSELDLVLREHIHLENNVLFPRVLNGS